MWLRGTPAGTFRGGSVSSTVILIGFPVRGPTADVGAASDGTPAELPLVAHAIACIVLCVFEPARDEEQQRPCSVKVWITMNECFICPVLLWRKTRRKKVECNSKSVRVTERCGMITIASSVGPLSDKAFRSCKGLTPEISAIVSPKGPFTHAIFDAISDAISRTKRALPYPARMFFFREASRGLGRKLWHTIWRHPSFQFLLTWRYFDAALRD